MTVIGGVGHTLPFVIGEFQLAVIAAVLVVVIVPVGHVYRQRQGGGYVTSVSGEEC
jgi:hypothetical protein